MIYTFTPVEMGIYVNIGKKSITQIKKELDCDIICNLNLFNGNWTGAAYTKADGKVVGTDGYGYYGFGFNTKDRQLTRGWSAYDKHENFFGCFDIVKNAVVQNNNFPAFTDGWRRRTVIGMTKDGKIGIYANTSLELPNTLRTNLSKAGFVEAVVLDGGGSTQLICPTGTVTSSDVYPRVVHTLFWAKLRKENKPVYKAECPYKEPTVNIRNGSIGEGAKWTQWMLNQHGYNLVVDGIFGWNSRTALIDFQKKSGLVADGISGALTREKLRIY